MKTTKRIISLIIASIAVLLGLTSYTIDYTNTMTLPTVILILLGTISLYYGISSLVKDIFKSEKRDQAILYANRNSVLDLDEEENAIYHMLGRQIIEDYNNTAYQYGDLVHHIHDKVGKSNEKINLIKLKKQDTTIRYN